MGAKTLAMVGNSTEQKPNRQANLAVYPINVACTYFRTSFKYIDSFHTGASSVIPSVAITG